MIAQGAPGIYKDIVYFNSTRNYTLALLNAFNNVQSYVETSDSAHPEKAFTVPVSFGNYEKALVLDDYNENEITSLNFNFLPRLVVSFEGMTKVADRQTQKYQKFSKTIPLPAKPSKPTNSTGSAQPHNINFAYNSLSYDFSFGLLLQTRGLTQATQITETILSKFNPSLNLLIEEFPLLDTTETQILISDPTFEIITEFETTDVNIINVSFEVTVRGNIYSPIGLTGAVDQIGIYMNIWEKKRISDSKLAAYWNIDTKTKTITQRSFDATGRGSMPGRPEPIVSGPEAELIKERPDYHPHELKQHSRTLNEIQ